MTYSLAARLGVVVCAVTVGLNALLAMLSLVPPHRLMPDGVSTFLSALPVVLVAGMMILVHGRAAPALNRIGGGGSSSQRRAAQAELRTAVLSQVAPRWRPGFAAACAAAGVTSLAALTIGGNANVRRNGDSFLLQVHGQFQQITAAEYQFHTAMWQAASAAGSVVFGLYGILVFLARPGDPPRQWWTPATDRVGHHHVRQSRVWPLKRAQSVVQWTWPDAVETGWLRTVGPLVLVGCGVIFLAFFAHAFLSGFPSH